jgi:hypothetical protein
MYKQKPSFIELAAVFQKKEKKNAIWQNLENLSIIYALQLKLQRERPSYNSEFKNKVQ